MSETEILQPNGQQNCPTEIVYVCTPEMF